MVYPTSSFWSPLNINTSSSSTSSFSNKGLKFVILSLFKFNSTKLLQIVIPSIFVIAVPAIFNTLNWGIKTSLMFPKLEFWDTFNEVKLLNDFTAVAVLIALLETSKVCNCVNLDTGVILLNLFELIFKFTNAVNESKLSIFPIELLLKFNVFNCVNVDKLETLEIEFLDKSNVVKPVKLSIPDKSEIWQLLKSSSFIVGISSVIISRVLVSSSCSIIFFDNLVFRFWYKL